MMLPVSVQIRRYFVAGWIHELWVHLRFISLAVELFTGNVSPECDIRVK